VRTLPDANPGTPDIRGPWRYLLWTLRCHWPPFVLTCLFNVLWVTSMGVSPGLIGEAINAGLIARNQTALLGWGLALFGVGAVQVMADLGQEYFTLEPRMGSGFRTLQLVTRKVCFLGATVGRRVSAGDLVTVGVSDIQLIGGMMDVEARGVGGVVSFAVVAALMLLVSWPAGLLVLAGVPVILLITTRISNVQRSWQKQVRDRQSELTDEAVDIVHGLRVLRGIGGERLFAGRYRDGSQRLRATVLRQARVTALLGAANTFLPSLLLTGVVALAAQLTLARQLSAGQLVAFYGYAMFMSSPIYRMTGAVSFALQAHVAAANVVRLLRTEPDIGPGPDQAAMPSADGGPADGVLADPRSGLVVPARGLTAVVCAAGDAAALADRLGRYAESKSTYRGQPLAELPLAAIRERVLVSTVDAHLFTGQLRHELDPADRLGDDDNLLWAAIDAAAARDIIEALPEQLGASVAAGGREFSGGQQQRLRLARALMADPDVLILIDPTSAVDAHTETRMAEGITRLRHGRATVVFTTSILLLGQADNVVLVIDGTVAAEGTHEALFGQDPRYRALVERGMATA
jgi:ABC-type multidrug transport system fused ATPase/permease subunit